MPKLVVLDGNSLLYRGYFAMRSLSTSDHLPTNAVFSFVLMLMTVLEREKPDVIYAAFDPPGGATFRHVEHAEYKGNRQAIPDDLAPQRAPAREAARAFRVPVIEIPGFEADDVCGTLAERAKELGYETLIVTGDTDVIQLVDDSHGPVRVMMTVKGVTDTVTYDEAAVQSRYGLSPGQIPDFKALKGDPSDNLPGVAGIGEKGASKLLGEFGTVENLLAHTDALAEKTRNALIASKGPVLLYKRLATIVRDVELPDWVDFAPGYQQTGPDYEAVRSLFERLEFRTLLKRLPPKADAAQPPLWETGDPPPPAPRTAGPRSPQLRIDTRDGLARLLTKAKDAPGPIGLQLHLEPAGATVMSAELRGVAIASPEGTYYSEWGFEPDLLSGYLGDPAAPKAVYDLKLLSGVLGRAGVELRGVVFDTLLAAYLLNAGRTGYPLAGLAADYAGVEIAVNPDDPAASTMEAADAIRQLAPILRNRLEVDGLARIHDEIELPLSPILARMERAGVSVDAARLGEVSEKLGQQIAALEDEIFALAGQRFSVGSTKQLQEVLFEKLQLPAGKKTKTGYSTGAEVLEDLAAQGHEIARKVINWREVAKLKSTYADALPALINPETGRIHTSLNQTVASTGRLSSSNPNLQNIPIRTEAGREIRKAFVAPRDRILVSADYSQIELRLFAHMTRDPALVEAFRTNTDVHEQTARRIFRLGPGQPVTGDQRRQAKTINFAVIYGASPYRVAIELGISQSDAAELIKAYLALYPGVRKYVEGVLEEARVKGYVRTLLGRRRYVPDINSRVFQFRQAAEREAGNMPVQGTSADIMKLAMLRVDGAIAESGLSAVMILQVHDELLFECPPDEAPRLAAIIKDAMEHAARLDIPLRVEVKSGRNWWEVTPVEEAEAEQLALAA